MTKPTTRNDHAIDKLLQDRAQYVTWLARLDASSDAVPAVPDGVRIRIRADYHGRLQTVVEALRTHTSSLEEQLAELEVRRSELSLRESDEKDKLSEAELRHAVGEYDDARWQNVRGEHMRVLVATREELSRTTTEIERLSEVLATIRAPVPTELAAQPAPEPEPAPAPVAVAPPEPPAAVKPPPAPPAPPAPAPAPSPPVEPVIAEAVTEPAVAAAPAQSEMPLRPGTPKPAPPKPVVKPKEEGGKTLWFPSGKPADNSGGKLDELAFLKSVTGGEVGSSAPPGKRQSGGFARSAEPSPAAEVHARTPAPPPAPVSTAPAAEASKDRASSQNAPKTLKCAECGTMNRPTEWYCERCGAELAAL